MWSELHKACVTELESLHERQGDLSGLVDCKTSLGSSALHLACVGQSIEIVHQLIEWKADINSLNCSLESPLHWASVNINCFQILDVLLEHSEIKIQRDIGSFDLGFCFLLNCVPDCLNCRRKSSCSLGLWSWKFVCCEEVCSSTSRLCPSEEFKQSNSSQRRNGEQIRCSDRIFDRFYFQQRKDSNENFV